MKRGIFVLPIFSILFFLSFVCAANSKTLNFPTDALSTRDNAYFEVKTLKYEPFPVNAGEWFDVWVKAENVGKSDAKDAVFSIVDEYPFEGDGNSIIEFGAVPGTVSGYKYEQSGDTNIEANQVVMKFRVKVADNANPGENKLKIKVMDDKSSSQSFIYELPIEIEKTKTDFDVKIQDVDSQGLSLLVSNVGDADAKTVSLSVANQAGIDLLQGNQPSALGDLKQGEFISTRQNIILHQGIGNFVVRISYVDSAGVVSFVEKNVLVEEYSRKVITSQTEKTYLKWVFGIVGFLLGIFVVMFVVLSKKRNKSKK